MFQPTPRSSNGALPELGLSILNFAARIACRSSADQRLSQATPVRGSLKRRRGPRCRRARGAAEFAPNARSRPADDGGSHAKDRRWRSRPKAAAKAAGPFSGHCGSRSCCCAARYRCEPEGGINSSPLHEGWSAMAFRRPPPVPLPPAGRDRAAAPSPLLDRVPRPPIIERPVRLFVGRRSGTASQSDRAPHIGEREGCPASRHSDHHEENSRRRTC